MKKVAISLLVAIMATLCLSSVVMADNPNNVTWYPNWMAYRAAEVYGMQVNVAIGPYMQKPPAEVDGDWYILEVGR